MSEVRFTTARHCAPAITVVSAAEYPKVFVALGGPDEASSAEVHYIEALHRSLPHEQENCPHCIYPMISKTWIPAALCPLSFGPGVMEQEEIPMISATKTPMSEWQSKVVELPPSAMMLATQLRRGMTFAICRGKGRQHKKVLYHIFRTCLKTMGPAFDVRPILLKTWGQHEWDRDNRRPTV